MRKVVKGLNYTEVHTTRKGSSKETIHHWLLQKERKPTECGVWLDGKKIRNFEDMLQNRESV